MCQRKSVCKEWILKSLVIVVVEKVVVERVESLGLGIVERLLMIVVMKVVLVVVERVSRSEHLVVCFLGRVEIVEVDRGCLRVRERLCAEIDMKFLSSVRSVKSLKELR